MARIPGASKLTPGFCDRVHDAQATFRALLRAASHPGSVVPLPVQLPGAIQAGLCPALAAMVLTLCDVDTPVHWSGLDPAGADWLRFHAGAPLIDDPARARFVVARDIPPALDALGLGTDEAPEGSATLLLRLASLVVGTPMRWRGPGIEQWREIALPLPLSFWASWAAQHKRFPLGVDVFATDGSAVMALPRSTMVTRLGVG